MISNLHQPSPVSDRSNHWKLGRFGRFIHKFYVEKINRVVVIYIGVCKQPSETYGGLGKQYPAASLSTSRDPPFRLAYAIRITRYVSNFQF